MKFKCEKIMCITTIAALCISTFVQAATITTNEELEKYTTTKRYPWLTRYHLTTAENIENGYKGGEGYQITMSLSASKADPKYMIRGDDTSGTVYSTDGGESWTMSDTLLQGVVSGLAFYPDSSQTAFAVVDGAQTRAGVYKSDDGGKTWNRKQFIPNTSKHYTYTKIGFGKKDEATGIYPGYLMSTGFTKPDGYSYGETQVEQRGIYKSVDGGDTWEQLDYFKNGLPLGMWIDDESDTLIVCTRNKGVSVSYDGGATWTEKNNGWTKIGSAGIAVDPYNKDHWIAIATDSNPDGDPDGYRRWMRYTNGERPDYLHFNILYETLDGGNTWTPVTSYYNGGLVSSANSIMIAFSYQKADNGNTLLYISYSETVNPTRVSSDYGKTFYTPEIDRTNSMNPYNTGWYANQLCFTKDVTMASLDGVCIYNDETKKFEIKNSGISGGLGMTYTFDKDGVLRFIGLMDIGIHQVGKYAKYDGYDWYDGDFPLIRQAPNFANTTEGRSTEMVAVDPRDENHCFTPAGATTYGGTSTIIETKDGYDTSIRYSGLYQYLKDNNKTINMVKINVSNPDVIYSSNFVSRDNGVSWKEIQYFVQDAGNTNGNICYAMSNGYLYMSTDAAKTWNNTGFYFSGNRKPVHVDTADDYVVWVPIHGKSTLYRVDLKNKKVKAFGANNGIVSPNERACKDLQITDFAQHPTDPDHIIISGTDYYDNNVGYKFESFDGGEHFEYLEIPYGGAAAFHPTKPLVYLGGPAGTWVYNYEIKAQYDDAN